MSTPFSGKNSSLRVFASAAALLAAGPSNALTDDFGRSYSCHESVFGLIAHPFGDPVRDSYEGEIRNCEFGVGLNIHSEGGNADTSAQTLAQAGGGFWIREVASNIIVVTSESNILTNASVGRIPFGITSASAQAEYANSIAISGLLGHGWTYNLSISGYSSFVDDAPITTVSALPAGVSMDFRDGYWGATFSGAVAGDFFSVETLMQAYGLAVAAGEYSYASAVNYSSANFTLTLSQAPVPEPSVAWLFVVGCSCVAVRVHRRRSSPAESLLNAQPA